MASFKKLMEEITNDPIFERLTESFTNYSFFNFCSLKENHTTHLISWMLNPRESHGSHIFLTKFLHAVCKALSNENCVIRNRKYLHNKIEKIALDEDLQWELIFDAEVNAGNGRACDIVGVSLNKDLAIIIENKISAKISGDQLDAYNKYATQLDVKYVAKILMDANTNRNLLETEQYRHHQSEWISLDYNWLLSATEEFLSRNRASTEVKVILQTFLTELECYLEENLDQKNIYWSDTWKDISYLGQKYYPLWRDDTYIKYRSKTAFWQCKRS